MEIEFLRTQDRFFENLPNWPYRPKYLTNLKDYHNLRVHYIDEGPKNANDVFLCLHGQPTWSYLYRKMIPIFLKSGARVIAPDWLGFGRSDKPLHDKTYTFHFHRNMALAFLRRLDLKNINLVVQDWGGLLGLTLPIAAPQRFKRLLVMNTALALGRSVGKSFNEWRAYSNANPDLDIARLMKRTTPIISAEEAQASAAPFPDIRYKAGVRRFPQIVMTEPSMEGVNTSKKSLKYLKEDWCGESFMAIGMKDPVLGPKIMEVLRRNIKGCPNPMEIAEGGHFVQEWGEKIAKTALSHWGLFSSTVFQQENL